MTKWTNELLENCVSKGLPLPKVYKLFTITPLLALVIFVSLMRENLRGLGENLTHKIRLFKMTISPGINGTCCILSDSCFKMDPDPQSMRSATQRWPVFYGMSMIGNLGKLAYNNCIFS